jgi:hypothetical protein
VFAAIVSSNTRRLLLSLPSPIPSRLPSPLSPSAPLTFPSAGLWILTPQWLSDSVLADRILPEGGYEVSGYQKAGTAFAPRRARMAVQAVRAHAAEFDNRKEVSMHQELLATPQSHVASSDVPLGHALTVTPNLLFSNKVFLLYGSFPNSGPPRSKIADLLQTGDAVVVSSIDELCRHSCRLRWRGKRERETPSNQSQGGSSSASLSVSVSGGGKSDGGTGKRGRRIAGEEVNHTSASVLSIEHLGESPSGDAKVRPNTDCAAITPHMILTRFSCHSFPL